MDEFSKYTSSIRKQGNIEQKKNRRKNKKKLSYDPLKIVYISSPMKVKTCESKFRSLVQELTGKNSQVAMFMEVASSHADQTTAVCQSLTGVTRSSETEKEKVKIDQINQWSMSSDQNLSVVDEELGSYVVDESFETGGGFGWELDLPWRLLDI